MSGRGCSFLKTWSEAGGFTSDVAHSHVCEVCTGCWREGLHSPHSRLLIACLSALTCQVPSPRVSELRARGSYKFFNDLTLEVTLHHFHSMLLVRLVSPFLCRRSQRSMNTRRQELTGAVEGWLSRLTFCLPISSISYSFFLSIQFLSLCIIYFPVISKLSLTL